MPGTAADAVDRIPAVKLGIVHFHIAGTVRVETLVSLIIHRIVGRVDLVFKISRRSFPDKALVSRYRPALSLYVSFPDHNKKRSRSRFIREGSASFLL